MPDVVRSVRGLGPRSKSLVNDHRPRQHRVVDKRAPAKIALARLGSICNERLVYNLNGLFNYLHVGWWLQAHGVRARTNAYTRARSYSRSLLPTSQSGGSAHRRCATPALAIHSRASPGMRRPQAKPPTPKASRAACPLPCLRAAAELPPPPGSHLICGCRIGDCGRRSPLNRFRNSRGPIATSCSSPGIARRGRRSARAEPGRTEAACFRWSTAACSWTHRIPLNSTSPSRSPSPR